MERQTLLYRDAHLVVVNKPSGLAVHRGWASDRDTALSRARDTLGQRVHLAHRLDRGTSGVLLFALDAETHRALSRAFELRRVRKTYLALVRGHAPPQGVIDHPIRARGGEAGANGQAGEGGEDAEDGEHPLEACTLYHSLGNSAVDRCSLVRAEPRTGRPHQLRRHLKHIDHPIIGDTRHGDGAINRHYRAHYGLHRLALHALRLEFEQPHTGASIEVEAPLPADLAAVLAALGLSAS